MHCLARGVDWWPPQYVSCTPLNALLEALLRLALDHLTLPGLDAGHHAPWTLIHGSRTAMEVCTCWIRNEAVLEDHGPEAVNLGQCENYFRRLLQLL